MRIVFCNDPLRQRAPDPTYEPEVVAAQAAGLDFDVVSYEALVDERQPRAAVRYVRDRPTPELAMYRGWMLRPDDYAQLLGELSLKGIQLINSPSAYLHCHYLPEWYPGLAMYTPLSVWLDVGHGLTEEAIIRALQSFGQSPLIVKDFVKSRKHEWEEACYVPSAADLGTAMRVVNRFLQLQGDDLAGGLVFREFVELEQVGHHLISGMPLSREARLFYLDGELLAAFPYWSEGSVDLNSVPLSLFTEISQKVRSRFFTMDVARRTNGEWIVVELGDGQVAGLPEGVDPIAFYRALVRQSERTA